MFSGKSTELSRRIRRHKIAHSKCLVVKYAGDTRYENEPGSASDDGGNISSTMKSSVITHDRQSLPAVPCLRLGEVDNVVHQFDVIGVDEGQFFPDLAEHCERWANLGKTVIVAALDSTFQRKPFNDVLQLVPLAEEITKLSAVCANCSLDASFTKRIDSDNKNVQVIGGAESYVATCRTCHDVVFETKRTPVTRTQSAPCEVGEKVKKQTDSVTRKRRSSAFGLTPGAVVNVGESGEKNETEKTAAMPSAATPSVTPSVSLSRVGEKMRALALESPATPYLEFAGFGSPVTVAKGSEKNNPAHFGTAKKKKALGLGAAAAAAMNAPGLRVRGAGGPGRSPIMDLASRGMGAVARSPLANVR